MYVCMYLCTYAWPTVVHALHASAGLVCFTNVGGCERHLCNLQRIGVEQQCFGGWLRDWIQTMVVVTSQGHKLLPALLHLHAGWALL